MYSCTAFETKNKLFLNAKESKRTGHLASWFSGVKQDMTTMKKPSNRGLGSLRKQWRGEASAAFPRGSNLTLPEGPGQCLARGAILLGLQWLLTALSTQAPTWLSCPSDPHYIPQNTVNSESPRMWAAFTGPSSVFCFLAELSEKCKHCSTRWPGA